MFARRLPIIFLILTLVSPGSLRAYPVISASFNNRTAATGACLQPLAKSASSYLSKYKIRVRSGTKGQGKTVNASSGSDANLENSVAKIIQRVESLGGGGAFGPLKGLQVWSIPDLDISARHTGQGLIIKTSNNKNIALVAHELGHQVGNSSGWYSRYNKAVPSSCHFSDYSRASHGFGARNEEFAEAFSIFLTNPSYLKNGSNACQDAYKFFSKQMFGGRESDCQGGGGDDTDEGLMMASAQGPHVHGDTCDHDPGQQNRADLAETSRYLETAAHTQETADHESGSGSGSGKSAFGSTINMNMIGSMAVQFLPVLTSFLQAKSQQKAIQEMYGVPNLLQSSGLATTPTNITAPATTVTPINLENIVPTVDTTTPDSGSIGPSVTTPSEGR
ncbi:MAG: hypothetical protein KF789_07700 [Bdellovibrionaceae bacterium]|nr:hypothetical protein [Pseudobdellovibrionaceae bacterium]